MMMMMIWLMMMMIMIWMLMMIWMMMMMMTVESIFSGDETSWEYWFTIHLRTHAKRLDYQSHSQHYHHLDYPSHSLDYQSQSQHYDRHHLPGRRGQSQNLCGQPWKPVKWLEADLKRS